MFAAADRRGSRRQHPKTYDIDRATHSRQLAQGVTRSKTLPQIEAKYTAAKADALHAREIAEAEARRDWQNTKADAHETFLLAEAAAKRDRALTTANVQKTYADATYERADAQADAVLHDVHFVVVRLPLPPAGGGPPLASSLLGAAESLLGTELLGLHDFFGEVSQGFAGEFSRDLPTQPESQSDSHSCPGLAIRATCSPRFALGTAAAKSIEA